MIDSMVEVAGENGAKLAVRRLAALLACMAEGPLANETLDPLHLDAHAAELDENGKCIRAARGRWPAAYRRQAKQLLAAVLAPASGRTDVARKRREWLDPTDAHGAPGSGSKQRRPGRSRGTSSQAR